MPAGTWIYERSGGSGGGGAAGGLVIGFVINDGTVTNNAGPMLPAPRAGSLTRCVTVIKASISINLTFTIRKNNVPVCSVTVAALWPTGEMIETTGFTSAVAVDDLFTIDITSGGPGWKFTAQLE